MNFEFIVEENFKNIIYYDCENLYKYIEEGKIKNIINITESIIKAIIIYYFIYHSQDKISMKKILNFDLKELMELGYSKKICNINSMSLYNDLQILKIEIDPNNYLDYYYRGFSKFKLEDYISAISDYTRVIELNSDYTEAYYFRGRSKGILNDYRGSILDLTKAIELKADYVDAYIVRGSARLYLKQKDSAC